MSPGGVMAGRPARPIVGAMTPSGAAMTDQPVLTWDEQDGVLHAAICRPPANALGPPLVDALTKLVDEFEQGSAKVLVLSSAVPGFFAAGADIKHVAGLTVEGFADYRDAARAPLERLGSCRRPSIAVIDGRALGGGLELAMACTLRFASPAARLGLPEVMLGLIPGGGGTQRLPHLVGRGRALELMLTAREIDAAEAWRIGLVDRLVSSDVLPETLDTARRMARASGPAMSAIMHCVNVSRDLPHDRGMAVEGVALLSAFEEGDAREGIAAFLEKRPPDFA
jgi:enoyl-CoA hydratase/carnithine racemase